MIRILSTTEGVIRAFGPGLKPCRWAVDVRWRPGRGRGEVGPASEGVRESSERRSMISREEVDAVSEAEREDDDDDDDSELDDPDGSGFSKFRLGAVFEREILAA